MVKKEIDLTLKPENLRGIPVNFENTNFIQEDLEVFSELKQKNRIFNYFDNRAMPMVINCNPRFLNFSGGDSQLWSLISKLKNSTIDDLKILLNTIDFAYKNPELYYSFRSGNFQWMAKGRENLLDDLSNANKIFSDTLTQVKKYFEKEEINKIPSTGSIEFSVIINIDQTKLFWIHVDECTSYTDNDPVLGNIFYGFLFKKMPFDDTDIQFVFEESPGMMPTHYDNIEIRYVNISGDIKFNKIKETDYQVKNNRNIVYSNNPLNLSNKTLNKIFKETPKIISRISRINNLPYIINSKNYNNQKDLILSSSFFLDLTLEGQNVPPVILVSSGLTKNKNENKNKNKKYFKL